ncbi:MAG TPA: M56 family peptidase [Sphingomonadales bacterium]|nr:M56 family peptidase [Sphingomonadales bacterium]
MANLTDIMISLAMQQLWQATALAVMLFLTLKAMPRLSYEIRSWLWLAAFMLAVFMPLAIFLPGGSGAGEIQGFLFENIAPSGNEQITPNSPINFYFWGATLWMIGTVFQLTRLCRSVLHTRRIINDARILPDGFLAPVDGGDYPVYCSDQISGPLVTGVFRQIILLPPTMTGRLSPDVLRQILYHEYAHIQRHDIRIIFVQKILSALYWWNPVLYLIGYQINQSREMACDERAVLQSRNIQNYTRSLLSGAEHILITEQSPLMVGIFHNRKGLTQRIERLKNMNIKMIKHNKTASLFWCLSLIGLTLATVYTLTPRLATASQDVLASEADRNLLPISQTPPVYPQQAQELKLEGYVIVMFDIMADGTTANVTIRESSNKIFNEPSIITAKSLTYEPRQNKRVIKNIPYKIVYTLGNAKAL